MVAFTIVLARPSSQRPQFVRKRTSFVAPSLLLRLLFLLILPVAHETFFVGIYFSSVLLVLSNLSIYGEGIHTPSFFSVPISLDREDDQCVVLVAASFD